MEKARKTIRTLETLTKLTKKKVEDRQKEIAELNVLVAKMEERLDELNRAIDKNGDGSQFMEDPTLYLSFSNFITKSQFEIEDIKEAKIDAEKLISEKQDIIKDIYAEQKRYEILHARKSKDLSTKLAKIEQAMLDETH